jgi:hypothetical protein
MRSGTSCASCTRSTSPSTDGSREHLGGAASSRSASAHSAVRGRPCCCAGERRPARPTCSVASAAGEAGGGEKEKATVSMRQASRERSVPRRGGIVASRLATCAGADKRKGPCGLRTPGDFLGELLKLGFRSRSELSSGTSVPCEDTLRAADPVGRVRRDRAGGSCPRQCGAKRQGQDGFRQRGSGRFRPRRLTFTPRSARASSRLPSATRRSA